MPGRRRKRRFSLELGASIVGPAGREPRRGLLKDLSEGGALILAEDRVDFGTIVRLTFEVDGSTCEATGRVLRCASSEDRFGIAIEFAHVNDALRDFLREPLRDRAQRVTLEIASD